MPFSPALLQRPWGVPMPDGDVFTKDPSVVRFGGRYLLYCSLPPAQGEEGWRIGIAESSDLREWTLAQVLNAQDGFAPVGIAAPGAVVTGDQVHMFYQSYGTGASDAICHATSSDGLTFEPDSSNPVFRPQGEWSCGRAIDADVIVDGDRLLMSYATRDPQMRVQMLGMAEADLGSDYGRQDWRDLSLDGPALAPELPWELECIEAPALIEREGVFVMFYAGGYNNEPQQIGYATSTDGVRWQRGSDEPILPNGGPGAWNSSESGHPGVLADDDGRSYLFFQGNDTAGRTNLIAGLELQWDGRTPIIPSA